MTQGAGRRTRSAGTFGSVDQRASGRLRARYFGPDEHRYRPPSCSPPEARHGPGWRCGRPNHPQGVGAAGGHHQARGSPSAPTPKQWMAHRELKDRTREHYRWLLDEHLLPAFGSRPLTAITADDVRGWHARFLHRHARRCAAHVYGLLRTIMAHRGRRREDRANPCVIRGAGNTKRAKTIRTGQPARTGEDHRRRCPRNIRR